MVCDYQWDSLAAAPCLWSESIFSPGEGCSLDLLLNKGGVVPVTQEVGLAHRFSKSASLEQM